ncbi:MAG: caspase family protein, partial [Alphaproteobacteria bacterium]|nr:caspase family protein [Alphaproteobacteria bacterium]
MRLLVALVVLAVWSTAAQAATGNRDAIAVIIGNKTYGGETPAVDFAHNDAEAMKRFAIDVLGYREGNIIDLRDASKAVLEDTFGTRESHEGKLNDYVREGRSDVVVFYSGHGVPNLDDQKGYLLPVDGNPNRIQLSGYPVDLLLENLSKIDARSMTVYLDACFSGDSPKGMIVQATSGVSVTPRLPVDRGGVVLITAAEGKQYASWDEEAGHGLFTHHLLLGLGGLADGEDFGNGDGEVTVSEVKAYLDEEMTYQARRRYGRRQNVTVFGDP